MSALDHIVSTLSTRHPIMAEPGDRRLAAVAVILRERGADVELLYIRRADRSGDPWSGHLAFPGGKVDRCDATPRATAERETREEVGIDLSAVHFLGRLNDSITTYNRAHVSGFVYHLPENVEPRPNGEIRSAHWTGLKAIATPSRQVMATVRGQWGERQVPAIQLFEDSEPVLWGLTYRMTVQLLGFAGIQLPGATAVHTTE